VSVRESQNVRLPGDPVAGSALDHYLLHLRADRERLADHRFGDGGVELGQEQSDTGGTGRRETDTRCVGECDPPVGRDVAHVHRVGGAEDDARR
jgi:hypothetical protein